MVATYNPSDYFFTTLESIVNQSVPPSEIIIVDDKSEKIDLASIENSVPKSITLIVKSNKENMGASYSRNLGSSLATTDFLVFFDDDDYSLIDRAKIHLEAFVDGSLVSYVSSRKTYPNGYSVEHLNPDINPYLVTPQLLVRKLLFGKSYPNLIGDIPSATLAMAKSAFSAVGGFDVKLRRLEDADLAIRLSLQKFTFSWSSKVAVERNATARADKGGLIETTHEFLLLEKHGWLLGWWRRNFVSSLISLRAIYFGGVKSVSIIALLKMLFNPFTYFVILFRFSRFKKRMHHDELQVSQ